MEPLPPVADVVTKLRAQGVEIPAGPVRVDGYGDSPELSASLLALIRDGGKRAGTSLLWAIEAENESIPQRGQVVRAGVGLHGDDAAGGQWRTPNQVLVARQ
jgi:hypothetical protein